jgi:hypothetical protein
VLVTVFSVVLLLPAVLVGWILYRMMLQHGWEAARIEKLQEDEEIRLQAEKNLRDHQIIDELEQEILRP